jgi:hypothetical protein
MRIFVRESVPTAGSGALSCDRTGELGRWWLGPRFFARLNEGFTFGLLFARFGLRIDSALYARLFRGRAFRVGRSSRYRKGGDARAAASAPHPAWVGAVGSFSPAPKPAVVPFRSGESHDKSASSPVLYGKRARKFQRSFEIFSSTLYRRAPGARARVNYEGSQLFKWCRTSPRFSPMAGSSLLQHWSRSRCQLHTPGSCNWLGRCRRWNQYSCPCSVQLRLADEHSGRHRCWPSPRRSR